MMHPRALLSIKSKKSIFLAVIGLCLWLQTAYVKATEMELNQQQITQALSLVFPLPFAFGEWNIKLSNPKVHLPAKGSRVTLQATVLASDPLKKNPAFPLLLKASMSGELFFDSKSQQIQLIRPALESLQVVKANSSAYKPFIQQIKQGFHKAIPIILLIDLNQTGLSNPFFTPKSIKVMNHSLILSF
jgi:hypothetical protein